MGLWPSGTFPCDYWEKVPSIVTLHPVIFDSKCAALLVKADTEIETSFNTTVARSKRDVSNNSFFMGLCIRVCQKITFFKIVYAMKVLPFH